MVNRPISRQGLNPVWVLIGVNIIIYLVQMFNNTGSIENYFGLSPADWMQKPWTLVSYMFLHGSFNHIIFNMITLYFFATFVIALVGETGFLLTYFAGGILGGLFFILFSYIPLPYFQLTQGATVIGASGAIFALGGLLMIMRPRARIMMFFVIPMPLWVGILIGFLLSSIYTNVAWQAHLGGIVYGALVGWYYSRRELRKY
jgi:uncharacterized protein